jgi:MFS family permease
MQKLFREYQGLRREIYVLFFGRIVTNMGAMIWPMLTLILSVKLGMDAATIADYLLLFSVCSLPMSLIGGKLADRCNKKNIIIFCDIISIVSYILCSCMPFSMTVLWIFFCASLFQSIEGPAYDALMADLSSSKDRERAFSLEYLGSNIGLVLAPTIGGLLFKDYLWLSFLISGLAIASSTILIFFLVKDISRVEDDESASVYEQDARGKSTWQVLKSNPLILLMIFISGLGALVYSQFNYMMPLDLARIHGDAGSVWFGTMTSLNCIIVVVFTPLITRWFRSLRDTGKMILGESLIVLGELIFCVFLGTPVFYYIGITVFTFGEIFNTLASSPYMTRRIPGSHRGRIIGLYGVFCSLFQGVSEILVGRIYDSRGSAAAWILVLAVGVISVLLGIVLRRKDQQSYPVFYQSGNDSR